MLWWCGSSGYCTKFKIRVNNSCVGEMWNCGCSGTVLCGKCWLPLIYSYVVVLIYKSFGELLIVVAVVVKCGNGCCCGGEMWQWW